MKINSILLILALSSLVFSAKFNIASTSVCTTTSSTGFCTKWEQNGTVQQQTAACFPQTVMLYTTEGYKKFNEIKIGDLVLGYDQESGQIFTKVTNWFHKQSEVMSSYLKIYSKQNISIEVSKKHNIAIDEGKQFSYLFAQDIVRGNDLFGSQFQVKNIEEVQSKGMYAPMTSTNNYYVFTEQNMKGKILAHCFANIKNPQNYQFLVNSIVSVTDMFIDNKSQIMHPAAQWMMQTFSFMLE